MLFSFSKSYALGLLFIFMCAFIWAGASVLVQYIYEDLDFESPFLVTYICNSLFLVYLPLWQIWVSLGWIKNPPKMFIKSESPDYSLASSLSDDSDSSDNANEDIYPVSNDATYSHYDVMKIAMIISPIWFVANCLYNYSLLMTSVSSSTIISNLSGGFTLAFSYLSGIEEITLGKVLGLTFCFAGAVLVGLQDAEDGTSDAGMGQRTITGDIVAVLAAVGYGVYTTIIRRQIPTDDGISMQLLLGYIGLFNALMLSPVLIVMIAMKIKDVYSVTPSIVGFISLNGLCDNVLSDYLWARAVILTSPTIATIGMSITIPLAMISDLVLGKGVPSIFSIFGAFLVVIGFTFVNVNKEVWENIISKLRSRFCPNFDNSENLMFPRMKKGGGGRSHNTSLNQF